MNSLTTLTAKQTLFLDALVSDDAMGDLRTAMRLAGYSDNTKVAYCTIALFTLFTVLTYDTPLENGSSDICGQCS